MQTTFTRRSTLKPFLFGVFFKVQALNYGSLLIARSCLSAGGALNPSGADCWRKCVDSESKQEEGRGKGGVVGGGLLEGEKKGVVYFVRPVRRLGFTEY